MRAIIVAAILAMATAAMAQQGSGSNKQATDRRTHDAALTAQEWENLQELKRYGLDTNCVVPTNAIVMPTPLSNAEIVAATNSPAGLKTALQTIRQYQLDNKQALQDIRAWQTAQERYDRDTREIIRDVKTLAREFWIRVLGRPKQPG